MVPFYVLVSLNVFLALTNMISLRGAQSKRQRAIALGLNAASIATASWNWVVGGVLLRGRGCPVGGASVSSSLGRW